MSMSDASSAIDAYCRDHLDEMLHVLEQIVNIDSCSPNPRGVDAVASILDEGLTEAGCRTERIAPPKSESEAWVADFFLPEIGSFDLVAHHLMGRRDGDGN